MNKSMHLSEHLASPSEAALSHSSELDGLRLSPNFSLGEVCKTSPKTADGNMKRWGLTGDRFLSARKRRVYLTGTCPLSDMIWVEGWCEDQEPFITEWGQECIMLLANHKGDFITKILTK